jgi:hypothetical protein
MLPVNESAGAWQIVSHRRSGKRGWSLPTLIHNVSFHYTRLDVFEDGVIDCWEGLDLPLFRKKLATRWVATAAPPGADFSVFNLGRATVEALEPSVARADLEARAIEAVRHWNPELRDLVDLGGDPCELRGKVRHAKLPSLDGVPVRTTASGERILGSEVPVVLNDGDPARLTRWFVFADGTSRIGPDGELRELAAAEETLLRGLVGTSIPDAGWIAIDGVGRARLSRGTWPVRPRDRIQEQRDELEKLRGGTGAIAHCVQRFRAYEESASPENLELLRKAYLAVPEHLRMYCGDMDNRDFPIQRALGMLLSRDDD